MLQAVATDRVINAPDASDVISRIERLPYTRWHLKIRSIIGTATFFDGFDAVAIAFVLPTLIGLWHLGPSEIGFLLSSGFFGQLIGASSFGWLAERYGRIRVLNWTILILSLFGLACAFAWSYWSLAGFRFLQGLGLGGEIPVVGPIQRPWIRSESGPLVRASSRLVRTSVRSAGSTF